MKYYATISAIAILAFALGWFMRGDLIYGAAYERAYDNPQMQILADQVSGKKK